MDQKIGHDIYTKRLKTFAAGLFNNVKYSDVVILLQGRKMPCHKIILAAQSDEWKNISQLSVLDLTDIKFQVAYTMIRWIYTDEIKVKMDVDFFLDLLKVAVRFKLESLHKRCRDAIVTMIKVDNITKIQKISEEIGDQTLADICKKFNADILTSSISSNKSNKKNVIPYGVKSKSKTDNMADHITRPLRSSKRSSTFTHSPNNPKAVGSNNETEVTTNAIKVNLMPLNTVNDAPLEREVTLVTSNESVENVVAEVSGPANVNNAVHDSCEEIEGVLITPNKAIESEDVEGPCHKNVEMRSETAKDKTANEEKATLLKKLDGEGNDNVARKSLRTSTKLKGKPILLVLNKRAKKDSVAIQKIIDASTKFNEKQIVIAEQSTIINKKNLDPLTKRKLKEERRKLKRRKEVLIKNLEKGITNARKPYKCSFCDVCFRFDHTRKEHENIHTGERPNVCEHCGKSFREKASLVRHCRIHNTDKKYSCHMCDKKYSRESFLNKHIKYHIGERKHKCTVCDKGFLYPRGLETHMAIHTGDRNWSCHICGKSYRRVSGLNYHLQSHANIRPFHCDQCDKSFLTKRGLALHLQSHSDERPYICDKCGSSFKYQTNLFEHCRTHTEGRPYKCEVCNKGFNVKKYLKRHYEFACGKLRSGNGNKESQKLETENESYEIHIADNDTDMGVLDPGTIIHVIDGKLADEAMYTEQTFTTNPL
ncbi:zinc finger protein 415 isoform X2 [Patella vulgata]|nr:zinc finger protein 415 isoform X2 [Patella vulgata]XP_050419132.1 zinc finger protein 415 isoform X2 [Patella vulgata]XP_050419133.1 zinc finger protein 415 isoform X2 [Patella vulgata]XP_050419134.1 zinc finger protein 415 isoform X2 [Patella vulgata]XP_050419135.1 zinc finger protein 415 isoform X2 [Patella vulgata]